ncbi:MAG: RNA polymerase sigma factor [Acidimicrobiia bacterium]
MNDVVSAVPVDVESLYRTHRQDLVALARVVCGSGSVAEEAVQEVFVSLHRRRPSIEPGREFAYLRQATLLQLRGRWRRQGTARKHLHSVGNAVGVVPATPESVAVDRDRRDRIDAAMRTLSQRQRECIALRYFADLTEPAIAHELGISVGSVKTHLHRARAVLTSSLEDLR